MKVRESPPLSVTPLVCIEWQSLLPMKLQSNAFRERLIASFSPIRQWARLNVTDTAHCLVTLENVILDICVNGETILISRPTGALIQYAGSQLPPDDLYDADAPAVRSAVVFLEEPMVMVASPDGKGSPDIVCDVLLFWDSRGNEAMVDKFMDLLNMRDAPCNGEFQFYFIMCRRRNEPLLSIASMGMMLMYNGIPLKENVVERMSSIESGYPSKDAWSCNPRNYLQALWALLGQPIVSEYRARPTEPAARKARKKLKGSGGEVRVLHLRQHERSGASGVASGKKFEYSHRFVVRGFWRNQFWGPKRAYRRRIWVDSYFKGPADKPLIIGDRVYKE